jgi:hypothetical protein
MQRFSAILSVEKGVEKPPKIYLFAPGSGEMKFSMLIRPLKEGEKTVSYSEGLSWVWYLVGGIALLSILTASFFAMQSSNKATSSRIPRR